MLSEDLPAQVPEFQPGSRLAGYRLERQVGAGGMAVVFRAFDERLGRAVALKILSPGFASDSEFRRRFIAESRAAAVVDDPHIIPVYEAGEAGGVLFIAMRFVAGGDLRHVLEREGALAPDRAADFVSPVASALDAAHGAGLVHRDVKPGNILVDARAGRPDHVYLSDFGIVKGALTGNLTGVGSYLGTPDYMAPEQISGRPVDGRTDQYSLACVTFQLLTGMVPFQRDQLPAVIYAHLSVPPPSLVSRRPDLPAAVDQVVAKAMAKTAEERYESCGDFADALREALGVASYHRRGSASAPPSPPPGTAEAPEAVVPDHPDATAGAEPGLPPRTITGVPPRSASEPGRLTAAADVKADTSDVLAPADQHPSMPSPSEISPPTPAAPSRRPRWPHRRNRPKQRSSAVASLPDAAGPADSQLAEERGATAGPDEQLGEPGLLTKPTDHGADRSDLPDQLTPSAFAVPAVADEAAAPPGAIPAAGSDRVAGSTVSPEATPSEGLPAAAAAAAEPGPLMAAAETDVLAPVQADDENGTTSPVAPVLAGDDLPAAAATTPTGRLLAGDLGTIPGSGESAHQTVPPAPTPSEALPTAAAAVAEPGLLTAAAETDVLAPAQADDDSDTTSPVALVLAGDDLPAAAATTPTGRLRAGDLGTTPGSGEPADQLPWLARPGSDGDTTWPAQRAPRRRGPVTAWIRRHRLPVFALACAAVAAAATLPFISPSSSTSSRPPASPSPSISSRPVAAKGAGWVSLGNLSGNPSPVDIYLYSSGSSSPRFVQRDVAYGTLLPYRAINAGDYSVKVRAAGASALSSPVWSVNFTVQAGSAYTVAPILAKAQQGQLRVLDNDLTAPPGKAFVRVIQADANQGRVTFHCSCAAGAPGDITTDAAPGKVSQPTPIPTGTWTMTATGPSAKTSLPVTLTDGTVHTEIVISKPGGGIQIINLVQAPPSYHRVAVDLPPLWHNVLISSLGFSPSGTLAIASEQICLWDIAATRCTGTFGDAPAYALAFSPDGKTLAATDGNNSGNTYLWNVTTSSPTATTLTDPDPGAYWVAFSPDGKILAVGDGLGHTYLWNVATRKLIFPLTDPGPKGANSVAFSPDGKILAVGDDKGPAYLWDVATRKPIFTLSDPGTKGVKSVAFSPDGKLLVTGDANGQTYLWQVATGKRMTMLPDPDGRPVIAVACNPDNRTMAAGDDKGRIYIWNVVTGQLISTLTEPGNAVINSVAYSADGKILATGDGNGNVFLWYVS
jgi:serine/threonine-protein kinase